MSLTEFEISSVNRTSHQGTSSEDLPDPTPLPRPHSWHILVRPVPVRKETKGGIILPEVMQLDYANLTTVGKVLAFGKDVFKVGQASQSYDIGDYVVWSRLRGERFVYKGIPLVLLADDDVLMTVDSPTKLDPRKNAEDFEEEGN